MRRELLTFLFVAFSVTWLLADEPASAPLTPQQTTQLGQLMDRDWENRPPWAEMATAILKGGPMGSGSGWFTGSVRRHDWEWISERFPDAAADGRIEFREIGGLLERNEFARVDQDRDRAITRRDFVFQKNPLLEDDSPSSSIFTRLDNDSNGRLTMDELERWFKQSSDDSDFLSIDDLKDALGLAPQPPRGRGGPARARGGARRGPPPEAADPRWNMLGMLLDGEMGSLSEGPDLGDEAPELDLPLVTQGEDPGSLELTDRVIKLEEFRGKKPVVLIFGSFT